MNHEKFEGKIAALRMGDSRAFDYIYEQTSRAVFFAILYLVRDKMHAEDILQETYIRAIRSLDSYTPDTNFPAWLTQIGRNLALNHLKRTQREISTDFDQDSYRYGSQETHLPYLFDIAQKILTEEEYQILMLCQVAGYKRREVAAMLNIPIGTVTWKNNKALKKLKIYLQKEDNV